MALNYTFTNASVFSNLHLFWLYFSNLQDVRHSSSLVCFSYCTSIHFYTRTTKLKLQVIAACFEKGHVKKYFSNISHTNSKKSQNFPYCF